jgi:hypothetical protein
MKTFAVRDAFLKVADNDCVGGRELNRHSQGIIFVKAKNKADALETLVSLNYNIRAASVRAAMGTDVDALTKAHVITEGTLTITSNQNPWMVARVSVNEEGERVTTPLGQLHPSRESFGYEFIPVG